MTRQELLKEVSTLLGYQRLGSSVGKRLKGHLRTAIRRKIIRTNGKEVWLATPTMNDYDRTDLVGFLGSVMRWGKEYDREEVIRALANHLGFRRLTKRMQGPIKSAINSAIRQGNIVATGPTIRRIL